MKGMPQLCLKCLIGKASKLNINQTNRTTTTTTIITTIENKEV